MLATQGPLASALVGKQTAQAPVCRRRNSCCPPDCQRHNRPNSKAAAGVAGAPTWGQIQQPLPIASVAGHMLADAEEQQRRQQQQQVVLQPRCEAHAVHDHQQLPWWRSCYMELHGLQELVHGLTSQINALEPGPALLELLSAVEVSRSNILRPAGYFADSLARAEPQQAAAALALQQAAADATASIYASMPLLVLLLVTVDEVVQQLATSAATAQATQEPHSARNSLDKPTGQDIQHTSAGVRVAAAAAAASQGPGGLLWVSLPGSSLLVAPAAAAAASAKSRAALLLAQQAAEKADATGHSHACCPPDAADDISMQQAFTNAAATANSCGVAVSALRAGLDALDAAIHGTLPSSSLPGVVPANASPAGTHGCSGGGCSSTTGELSSPVVGCCSLRWLMLCRHLVSSWLPPVAAQAALAATAAATQTATATALGDAAAPGVTDSQPSAAYPDGGGRSADSTTMSAQPAPLLAAAPGGALSQSTGSNEASDGSTIGQHSRQVTGYTTRQLLQAALSTLSAVSTSSVGNKTVAPLLVLTEQQAGVIEPLLIQAGLACGDSMARTQQLAHNAEQPASTPESDSSTSTSTENQRKAPLTAFLPLLPSNSNANSADAGGATSAAATPYPCIVLRQDGLLQLHTSVCLEVHPGPGGCLLLEGLVDVTEAAWQVLSTYNTTDQQQSQQHIQEDPAGASDNLRTPSPPQQQQQQHSRRGVMGGAAPPLQQGVMQEAVLIPAGSGLRLLRVSTDVLQLLLSHHPHPGVRQQLYLSGLLPALHLQGQVLDCVTNLRQQLAAEQAASEGFVQLVLSGSCLSSAAVAEMFVQQLLPFARQHAAAEWQELQELAARQARADGRRLQALADAVQPWDVAHTSLKLVKQLTDLDWGRDLAPYFTLPGLIDRIDKLLHSTCNLRLLPAHTPQAGQGLDPQLPQVFSQQREQQQQGDAAPVSSPCSFQEWGPHVLHLLLLTAEAPAGTSQALQPHLHSQQQQPQLLLGHIMLELVTGGFPSCTLLQLPVPQHLPHAGPGPQAGGQYRPGSVVLRVPVPAAALVAGFGEQGSQPPQQQQQVAWDELLPLALPGPAALQALLHELGHALSYLCPSGNLQQLLQGVAEPAGSGVSSATGAQETLCRHFAEDSEGHSLGQAPGAAAAPGAVSGNGCGTGSPDRVGSVSRWLLTRPVGAYSACLLSGPPVGLDVREVSSHLFEHWVRHPTSIRALSRHHRLDCPLPQHVALQVPRLMGPPGGCSSIRLHNSLVEALADLDMHSTHPAASTASSSPSSSSSSSSSSGGGQDGRVSSAAVDAAGTAHRRCSSKECLRQPVPADCLLLDDLEAAATAGPVGGAKAAYVAARLLAAAAWKALGFEQNPLQGSGGLPGVTPRQVLCEPEAVSAQQPAPAAVGCGVLLGSGGFLPSHHTLIKLLGGSADVLSPVVVAQGLAATSQRVSHKNTQPVNSRQAAAAGDPDLDSESLDDTLAAGVCIAGWQPKLYHEVFQDVELS